MSRVLTVTKLGQKPSTQEKSLLQLLWLIRRLIPKAVSTGSTDKQFDFFEQSPHPSQISVLMNALCGGSGYSLRFRRRRFSLAHVCA
ncbi:hypothetical protein D9M72_603180 [compost metagenome]